MASMAAISGGISGLLRPSPRRIPAAMVLPAVTTVRIATASTLPRLNWGFQKQTHLVDLKPVPLIATKRDFLRIIPEASSDSAG